MVQPTPIASLAGVAADPPPQPTLADIKRIRQALDDCYDDEAGRYRGSDNDRAVSERLGVPRAWVSQERAHAYGPERCESDDRDLAELQKLSQRAAVLEAKGMEIAAEAESLRKDAESVRARLGARGVQ